MKLIFIFLSRYPCAVHDIVNNDNISTHYGFFKVRFYNNCNGKTSCHRRAWGVFGGTPPLEKIMGASRGNGIKCIKFPGGGGVTRGEDKKSTIPPPRKISCCVIAHLIKDCKFCKTHFLKRGLIKFETG